MKKINERLIEYIPQLPYHSVNGMDDTAMLKKLVKDITDYYPHDKELKRVYQDFAATYAAYDLENDIFEEITQKEYFDTYKKMAYVINPYFNVVDIDLVAMTIYLNDIIQMNEMNIIRNLIIKSLPDLRIVYSDDDCVFEIEKSKLITDINRYIYSEKLPLFKTYTDIVKYTNNFINSLMKDYNSNPIGIHLKWGSSLKTIIKGT